MADNMNLEKSMEKLDGMIEKLEKTPMSFDESLKIYEEALSLAKTCLTGLEKYKGKLKTLNAELEKMNSDDKR